MARYIIGFGMLLIAVGCIVWMMERAGLRPGHLPGDIVAERGNTRFYFPIVTSIVLSIILTGVLWIVGSLRR